MISSRPAAEGEDKGAMIYRRAKDGEWHWCTDCERWPEERDAVEEAHERPNDDVCPVCDGLVRDGGKTLDEG
jgi:rubrerythrin